MSENTDIYGGFAAVYDMFMDNAPYDEWAELTDRLWKRHGSGRAPKLVLDLACGTGSLSARLSGRGYEVIGVDASEDMLAMARARSAADSVLYLRQDMRELELYGTVDAAACLCDGINYILEPEELVRVFSLVRNYLNPGGVFVFDINTEYKYREILADNTFAECREDAAFIWDNSYYPDEGVNEYEVNFFVKDPAGSYRRFSETHYQRAYSVEDIRAALSAAGLTLAEILDGTGGDEIPPGDCERLFFAAVKGE